MFRTKLLAGLATAFTVLLALLGISRKQTKDARQQVANKQQQLDDARHIANTQANLSAAQHKSREEAAAHAKKQTPTTDRPGPGSFGDSRLHKD